MSKAQLVITAVVLEGRSKSEVARDYDVSRQWVQQLCKRYEAEGAAAFDALPPPAPQPPGGRHRARRTHRAAAQNPGPNKATMLAPTPSPPTWLPTPQSSKCLRCRRSGGSCRGAASSHPSPTNDPARPGNASKPNCPTNAGRPTSPTGGSPITPTWRSSTCSTTTPGSPSPARPTRHHRPRRRRHLHRGLHPLGHTRRRC